MHGQFIPISFFEKYGGLNLLLKCNYHIQKLDKHLPSIYLEMLEYCKELCLNRQDNFKSDLVLWNNQEVTIEGKSLF